MQAVPADPSSLERVIPWFIRLRWVACAGVVAAVLTVALVLRAPLPYGAIAVVTALLAASNAAYALVLRRIEHRAAARVHAGAFLAVQVSSDYAFLLALVYLGGLVENPFAWYFVFHVMLTAYLFPASRVVAYVGALAAALASLFGLGWSGVIPAFSLTRGMLSGAPARAWWQGSLGGLIGLVSTLAIAAYLMLEIKRRIAEKGRWVEVELDRYKSLDRIKSEFITQVTHELRGPLAAVNGFHEMLRRGICGEIPPEAREALRKASRRVDGLLHMIDEMIDYASLGAGAEIRSSRSVLALATTVAEVVEGASTQAEAKGIRILTRVPEALEIEASRDLLVMVLGNLVSNAIKYSPSGSTVSVSAADEGEETHLAVADQGMGIEAGELDRLFEEFFRTRRARERERDGTGLGLAIAKRAVERLGGRIRVYSEVDRGSTFHVYLPKGEGHG